MARNSLRSRSESPFVGSMSRPREARFKERPMALMVKSRPRRSSWMIAGFTEGGTPGFPNFSVRAIATSHRPPLGNEISADFLCSSSETIRAPAFFTRSLASLRALPSTVSRDPSRENHRACPAWPRR